MFIASGVLEEEKGMGAGRSRKVDMDLGSEARFAMIAAFSFIRAGIARTYTYGHRKTRG